MSIAGPWGFDGVEFALVANKLFDVSDCLAGEPRPSRRTAFIWWQLARKLALQCRDLGLGDLQISLHAP
jgi:hypothetical protein